MTLKARQLPSSVSGDPGGIPEGPGGPHARCRSPVGVPSQPEGQGMGTGQGQAQAQHVQSPLRQALPPRPVHGAGIHGQLPGTCCRREKPHRPSVRGGRRQLGFQKGVQVEAEPPPRMWADRRRYVLPSHPAVLRPGLCGAELASCICSWSRVSWGPSVCHSSSWAALPLPGQPGTRLLLPSRQWEMLQRRRTGRA